MASWGTLKLEAQISRRALRSKEARGWGCKQRGWLPLKRDGGPLIY